MSRSYLYTLTLRPPCTGMASCLTDNLTEVKSILSIEIYLNIYSGNSSRYFLSLYSHNIDGNTEITDSQGWYPSLTVVGGAGAGPEHSVHLSDEGV